MRHDAEMSDPTPPTLVFAYNADHGLMSRAFDSLHKLVSPGTYACNLCRLTHGPVGMRRAWRDFLASLGRPVTFVHRDQLAAQGVDQLDLPAVFERGTDGAMRIVLDAAAINRATSVDQLQAMLTAALDEADMPGAPAPGGRHLNDGAASGAGASAGPQPMVLIVMGVSGSGKTTVGRALAAALGWAFADADDHHPPANVAKMRRGEALDDDDRQPWLEALRALIDEHLARREPLVLACSALKQRYRDVLAGGVAPVRFVYLRGSFDVIAERMRHRTDHYMPPSLLESQFAALEEPTDAIVVDADAPVDEVTARIIDVLESRP